MSQYGAGVSFSKMKRSMKKKHKHKHKSGSRANKVAREKRKQTQKKHNRSKIQRSKGASSRRKACQCGTHHYTGSEPTPRGLGSCEECIPLHVVLRGKDGQLYENRGNMWSLL